MSKRVDNNVMIGLFNDSYPPVMDGVTLTVQNYARWLAAKGNRITVVTPWNPVKPPVEPGIDVVRYFSLGIPSRHPYRYGYPKADQMIWRRLRRLPFSIVHSHSPFSAGRLALYAAKHHDVPLVATFHSKYRTDLEHSLPTWMVKRIMKRVLEFFNAADEVWIPQAKVEETVREYGYRGPLTVVDNGIDLAPDYDASFKEEARHALGLPEGTIHLLFVGQHIREKGVDLIIDAVDRLRDLPIHMSFVGTGYAAADMKARIYQLGLDHRVTFYGMIQDRDTLQRLYASAHLFLFPSLYDNAPLVVREAAAMATPAILIHGSTAADVVADGVNGFLADNTPESYSATIRRLVARPEQIAEAGRGARATLTRSWQNVVGEVNERYKQIIERYGHRTK